jgi:GNAT superfamily N-acetyltransferase
MLVVRTIRLPVAGLEVLAAEARAEGFRFIDRLIAGWYNGDARFSGPSELLLGAFDGKRLIGIAGLIADPYSGDCGTGRLRHLYVRPDWRHRRIGTALVADVKCAAGAVFDRLRLRTDNAEAARFYEAIGFAGVEEPYATHALGLP